MDAPSDCSTAPPAAVEKTCISDLPDGALHHVFSCLGTPRDLCAVSLLCRRWRSSASDGKLWQPLFAQAWNENSLRQCAQTPWQTLYGTKMRQAAFYRERPRSEPLVGHRAGVRCVGLLPAASIAVTGALFS